jgi:hypothetical protein
MVRSVSDLKVGFILETTRSQGDGGFINLKEESDDRIRLNAGAEKPPREGKTIFQRSDPARGSEA